jgi:hypothetical protein
MPDVNRYIREALYRVARTHQLKTRPDEEGADSYHCLPKMCVVETFMVLEDSARGS